MDLTESWKRVIPQQVQDRYVIAETRNAAAILQATNPVEFGDICLVLTGFDLTLPMMLTKGGNKTPVAATLDAAFREHGWREAKYQQTIQTCLVVNPYRKAGERSKVQRESTNTNEGHQVDNVKGRIALDVEWNAKDGNLDRDISNFRALYEAGQIDVAVLVTRTGGRLRDLAVDLIHQAKVAAEADGDPARRSVLDRLAEDPLKSTTTTNFERLTPRMRRGDAGGCPMLAIAITEKCYTPPADPAAAVTAVAAAGDNKVDDTDG